MTAADDSMIHAGQSVLITGGTGSFGRTMVQRLLEAEVRRVRILSRDEAKQHAMRVDIDDPRLEFHVGDVRNERSVERAAQGCDRIFHAAALKQVPSCEFFPLEAVLTNIQGSANVIDAAARAGVRSVVVLSTDKAVLPVNAMGMTKALMEKIATAASRSRESDTTVSITRYGNVVYSRGSVVPHFVGQIRRGEVLTITDPDMTRFLMPLSDCVELVEFAFTSAQPGDTFVRKAVSARIGDLAIAINELFGFPVATKVIGTRHGEKLYETLATAAELQRSEDLGDYLRIPMDSRELNYAQFFEEGDPDHDHDRHYDSRSVELLDVTGIQELLMRIPEFRVELDAWTADRVAR